MSDAAAAGSATRVTATATATRATATATATATAATPAPGLIVADTRDASEIYGVHGAPGLTYWKALAGRQHLEAEVEAIEVARIPPGGLSGEHRHTRTEEIYFILRGHGEFLVDGEPRPARPGSLLLTGIGTVHGLRNTGAPAGVTDPGYGSAPEGHLEWLVIEMPSPATSAVLHGPAPDPTTTRPSERKTETMRLHDLREERAVDPAGVFTGPLRLVEIRELAAGDSAAYSSHAGEHTVFVLTGSGTATAGSTEVEIAAGTAVTLPFGVDAVITAHEGGLEFFHAELAVPGRAAR
ncbi:cupin domain-containing protein [Kitasatospora sp. NPDC002965]|uniref:cupin domain-containing protein n=1 Tax=Kitasatospora sp. NPDC002965 TaxID=3154775 RepID=UPI0033B53695